MGAIFKSGISLSEFRAALLDQDSISEMLIPDWLRQLPASPHDAALVVAALARLSSLDYYTPERQYTQSTLPANEANPELERRELSRRLVMQVRFRVQS
jgi:hypothetical protein